MVPNDPSLYKEDDVFKRIKYKKGKNKEQFREPRKKLSLTHKRNVLRSHLKRIDDYQLLDDYLDTLTS